jgi:hypothetical protein
MVPPTFDDLALDEPRLHRITARPVRVALEPADLVDDGSHEHRCLGCRVPWTHFEAPACAEPEAAPCGACREA